jgi:hypothetical protein
MALFRSWTVPRNTTRPLAPGRRDGDYAIDHTGVIYLMGRGDEYLGFMPPQTGPEKLTEILRKYLAKQEPRTK